MTNHEPVDIPLVRQTVDIDGRIGPAMTHRLCHDLEATRTALKNLVEAIGSGSRDDADDDSWDEFIIGLAPELLFAHEVLGIQR